ncbi:hypothetical protein BTDUT50_05530 [Neobacillus thermocopriae]|nr:hypothetical protein BTDUT50_05530 [Neobacillus thermocopriae]
MPPRLARSPIGIGACHRPGVPLFWPFSSKRWKVPLYRTGKGMEKALVGIAWIAFVYFGVNGLFHEWWRSWLSMW